ncbi:hypothetical protein BD769DRAFT_1682036 [Suillus cothurnatus]|nr:hypothetical protein BD769DRAFT_1682036 [Suillus cothurnatus]
MAPTTRAQAALALVLKKRMSQAVRAERMKNRFKTVNIDGPFRGTRSGLNAAAIPPLPIGEAQQPGVADVPQENMQDLIIGEAQQPVVADVPQENMQILIVQQEAYNYSQVLPTSVKTEQVKEEPIESPIKSESVKSEPIELTIKSELVKEEANIATLQNIKSETAKEEPGAVAIKIKTEED